ncbi:MAG: His/Gly/Thr/Pro-type tRNA ligase C-terminal domain-containing protein, partial [Thermoplasmatales archaeon]
FNDWEEKGVPIRLDIGKKELASRSVTISLRTGGKKNVRLSSLTMSLKRSFSEVKETLYRRAEEKMRKYLQEIDDLGKASSLGPNLVYWCGKKECADQIEKTGKSILGSLDDVGNCIVCGSKGKKTIISKKY